MMRVDFIYRFNPSVRPPDQLIVHVTPLIPFNLFFYCMYQETLLRRVSVVVVAIVVARSWL